MEQFGSAEKSRRLLWVGDAACSSGFARCTHEILKIVRHYWDVSVLGINYLGDPHGYPYPIYPAVLGGDVFGVRRLQPVANLVKPHVIVIQNDVWNIPAYLRNLSTDAKLVGVLAVDGKNCQGKLLNPLDHCVFWTEFGLGEAREGGYTGKATVIPLGVDIDSFEAREQLQARKAIGLPEKCWNGFIVGNVNRNQGRKRMDLTIQYFAEWVKDYRITDAWLFLQVAPTGDQSGYDVQQLARYYGIADRLILVAPKPYEPITESDVVNVYASFDVQVSTTQGEGFGLTTLEGMACAVPQIVPDWAALGEWANTAAVLVPCSSVAVTPGGPNAIGGIPDKLAFKRALDSLYKSPDLRITVGRRGYELARRNEFRWDQIGRQYAQVLQAFIPEPVHA